MNTLRQSYIYAFFCAIGRWFDCQWEESIFATWLSNQNQERSRNSAVSGLLEKLRCGYCDLFQRLKLVKLLQGSIFLQPWLFCAAAAVLAPLCPTIVSLGLVCAGLFSLMLKLGVDRSCRLTPSPLNIYVALYALIYGYATLTSTSLRGSLFPGLLTILFVIAFFCVTFCGFDRKGVDRLITAMGIAGVVIALYGFFQFMFPELYRNVWTDQDMFSTISFRVYSTLENPNVLGEYFLLVIPLACGMLFCADNWKKRLLWLAACGVMGVCLILTYSRGCYLGLLAAAAVFLVLLDRRFLVLGLIAIALCPFYLPESVISRFTSIGDLNDTSTSYRVSIWLGTLAMLKDYWFCGIGPGADAFNVVYPSYAHISITAPHSHNLYLQIMCDSGICGIGIFLVLLVAYYRMMFTAIRHEADRNARILQIAAVSAVTGFLVQSMTDYTFYNYRVMLLFWMLLGLSVLFTRMGRKKEVNA